MKLLEDKILADGEVLPGNILKVGKFLNHQIDVAFLLELGKEVKRLFENENITKIITVEASGIAIATAFASVMHTPVVFAKKHNTLNLSDELYTSRVHSYTHNKDYNMVVEKRYLSREDKVLIVDDFLAKGAAMEGLIEIIKASGAELVGCVAVIEKLFQGGGDQIRARGIRVESLAQIKSMSDDSIEFC